MQNLLIALISDLHYAPCSLFGAGRGDLADIMLLRTVHRLNRFIKPDLVVVLGDLLGNGQAADSQARLLELRAILGLLKCPWLVLPGNHDGDSDRFYSIMPQPSEWMDIAGCRLVPFFDEERSGYNAFRPPAMLERLAGARLGFNGPLVALQHISLHPPGAADCPYNLVNAEEVLAAMRRAGVCLSLGGHCHKGFTLLREKELSFVNAPALCEAPFRFCLLTLADDCITVRQQALSMPAELGLIDCHVHTPWAYCNENMDLARALDLSETFGLAGLVFTEHSSHLYFSRDQRKSGAHLQATAQTLELESQSRSDAYFAAVQALHSRRVMVGLEIDANDSGELVATRRDLARCRLKVGAVHGLPVLRRANAGRAEVHAEFLAVLEKFLQTGIRILAHPFRLLNHSEKSPPTDLFAPVCRLLRTHHVAAELNFHTNTPAPDFFRMCIENGVPLVFGSDAHNLYEVGEFSAHLEMLAALGCEPQAALLPVAE